MNSLPQLIHRFVADLPGVQRVVLAVSGGVDSMVLLHATVQARLALPVLVVHVNHQLSPFAATWQARVQDTCASLGIECMAVTVDINVDGYGLEEAARQARFRGIEQHLLSGDLVLMAHHRQDQLETFFLRLARGAGVRGLAAMASLRDWGPARLGRPFLAVDRSTIESYARDYALTWVEDESNASARFDRNFLRLQVMPLLQQRWPELALQVSQAADHLRESDDLLQEFAAEDLHRCRPRLERLGVSIEMSPLLQWAPPRRYNLVRHWLMQLGYRAPSRKRLEELNALLTARQDQNPLLRWGDCELRRYRQRIYCLPGGWQAPPPPPQMCAAGEEVDLGGDRLQWRSAPLGLAEGNYTVLARQQAPDIQRAHPVGRTHSQSLKKLLQEHGLEPWLREQVPLLLQDDRLVAVGDLWIEKSAAVQSGAVPVWTISRPRPALV